MEFLLDPQMWASLLTLTVLEIVLGIDNLVFISILSNKLPAQQQALARKVGLALAVISRLGLLFSIAWIASLTTPVFSLGEHGVSWRDIILIGGGLFLLVKGTTEIHAAVEGVEEEMREAKVTGFTSVVVQIMILDIVFSLDSVITAVGMANHLGVMATAVIIAVIIMLVASEPLSAFIEAHVSVKILALSFLLMVGLALIADGMGFHIPKGYLYFAMAFSVLVEVLNLWATQKRRAGHAKEPVVAPEAAE